MGRGLFVTGPIGEDERGRVVDQYGLGRYLLPYRASHYWALECWRRERPLPAAYFDWSGANFREHAEDLSLQPSSENAAVFRRSGAMADRWKPGGVVIEGFDLVGEFVRLDRSAVAGFACDEARPERRFIVEILVDGLQIGSALADHASARAKKLGLGDGCYGFSFVLPEALLARAKMIEARLANIGDAVGAPLYLDGKDAATQAVAPPPGAVEWSGGLRFTGWAELADGTPPEISVLIDGALVAQTRAEGWRHVDRPRPAAKCAFDFFLPEHFADDRCGRRHSWSDAVSNSTGAR